MALNPKIIDINVDKKYLKKIVAKQGDVKSRYLLFRFFNDYGVINLNKASVRIYIDKPDGTQIFNDLVIDKITNLAELELTTQTLALSGILKCELFISEDGATLSNIPFEIEVIKTLKKDSAIESTNEFSALTNALALVDSIDTKFQGINSEIATINSNIQTIRTDKLNKPTVFKGAAGYDWKGINYPDILYATCWRYVEIQGKQWHKVELPFLFEPEYSVSVISEEWSGDIVQFTTKAPSNENNFYIFLNDTSSTYRKLRITINGFYRLTKDIIVDSANELV
ncbi:BppU family phage baseplate upper protein [Clostridium perfringens]|uniref:BppU family phage baseplate upper protein n=1 Tax=Clostridium perfringens TaxID=1502 RepID=UPI002ED54A59|nr:BppU family phage baseplate upper protein [Clostridium perfringens]